MPMNIWGIILAAGTGSRLSESLRARGESLGHNALKQFILYKGIPLFWHSALAFSRYAGIAGLVFVFPGADAETSSQDSVPASDEYSSLVHELDNGPHGAIGLPYIVVSGGRERQDSVRHALEALPLECDAVLVHDAARPFVKTGLIARVADELKAGRPGVIPGVPVTDTIKSVSDAGQVTATPERSQLRAVQTPQGFSLAVLKKAHEAARGKGWKATDDAALLELIGEPVLVVEGQTDNIKITTAEDLALLKPDETKMEPCTGLGYDVHRYGGERPFILGGVPIATDVTVSAHSDGDTLLHALMDAMLGCVGLGDIGGLFPDTDKRLENISSGVLLAEVYDRCRKAGLVITNVDVTVIAQTPKIAPHRENIAKNLAKLLQLPVAKINVKATTEERLGFTGEKKGIKVMAVVSGLRPS